MQRREAAGGFGGGEVPKEVPDAASLALKTEEGPSTEDHGRPPEATRSEETDFPLEP